MSAPQRVYNLLEPGMRKSGVPKFKVDIYKMQDGDLFYITANGIVARGYDFVETAHRLIRKVKGGLG